MERKLAAILSADVVGYSRHMARDDLSTVREWKQVRAEITRKVIESRGRVVDSPGDNLLAEFPSALDATRAALEIQEAVTKRAESHTSEERMDLRVGVHLGDVMLDDERIYGDGVNIAARLEGLAEPGGIAISAAVHQQVSRKLEREWHDMGEQLLKNLPEPVRVFRAQIGPVLEGPGPVPGFAGRPPIAVLPFENRSGDPEQDYFADGIAEDLITRLASWKTFPVISRNSSFGFKGQSYDAAQLRRDLGAQYIVEGSVRRAGSRVRIHAQLIDTRNGHHVWGERYDRELSDIFDLQDEITESILGKVGPELYRQERERTVQRNPEDLEAWDLTMRGYSHFYRFAEDENAMARTFFERAVVLDPGLAFAWTGLALSHTYDWVYQWKLPDFAAGLAAASRAVEADPQFAGGHTIKGSILAVMGDPQNALPELRLGVELDPSFATGWWRYGTSLYWAGRADESVDAIERALRLSPTDPNRFSFLFDLAMARFCAGDVEGALTSAQESLRSGHVYPGTYHVLAAALATLDRMEEARAAVEKLREHQPDAKLEHVSRLCARLVSRYELPLVEGLRKAGFD